MTIEYLILHSDDHFESHLPVNGLYHFKKGLENQSSRFELRSYMYEVFLEKILVPGEEPDQLNCCKEAVAGSLLTCRSDCSFMQIELQAKLLNYFLGSNKSNINQTQYNSTGNPIWGDNFECCFKLKAQSSNISFH